MAILVSIVIVIIILLYQNVKNVNENSNRKIRKNQIIKDGVCKRDNEYFIVGNYGDIYSVNINNYKNNIVINKEFYNEFTCKEISEKDKKDINYKVIMELHDIVILIANEIEPDIKKYESSLFDYKNVIKLSNNTKYLNNNTTLLHKYIEQLDNNLKYVIEIKEKLYKYIFQIVIEYELDKLSNIVDIEIIDKREEYKQIKNNVDKAILAYDEYRNILNNLDVEIRSKT